jgi:hypothetical protein
VPLLLLILRHLQEAAPLQPPLLLLLLLSQSRNQPNPFLPSSGLPFLGNLRRSGARFSMGSGERNKITTGIFEVTSRAQICATFNSVVPSFAAAYPSTLRASACCPFATAFVRNVLSSRFCSVCIASIKVWTRLFDINIFALDE